MCVLSAVSTVESDGIKITSYRFRNSFFDLQRSRLLRQDFVSFFELQMSVQSLI